jgi:hypothetical protein
MVINKLFDNLPLLHSRMVSTRNFLIIYSAPVIFLFFYIVIDNLRGPPKKFKKKKTYPPSGY